MEGTKKFILFRSIKTLVILLFFLTTAQTGYSQNFQRIEDSPVTSEGGRSQGISMVDINGDGYLDIIVSNGSNEQNFFYRGDGNGNFTKVHNSPITADYRRTNASVWGDFDNDKNIDSYLVNASDQNNKLLQNSDNSFNHLTDVAPSNDNSSSLGGSWLDYNSDGYVDLFLANGYNDLANLLYRNNGDGTFTALVNSPVSEYKNYTWHASWADIDGDGDMDLYTANKGERDNALYVNEDESFTRKWEGVIVNDKGANGISWGDFNNDGAIDLFTSGAGTELRGAFNSLYINDGSGRFTEITDDTLVNPDNKSVGSCIADFDNDGYLDIYVSYRTKDGDSAPNLLYRNNGDGSFSVVQNVASGDQNTPRNSLGVACGDYNKDGFVDVMVANANQDNQLYRNEGNTNNWLVVDLEGTRSNYSAIGAEVKAKASIDGEPTWQSRTVRTSTGHRSQNSLQVEFGMGSAQELDSLVIKWPSGIRQVRKGLDVNQHLSIKEDTSSSTMSLSIDDRAAIPGDTTTIPLHLQMPSDSNISSFEITFNVDTDLQFTGIDTSGSLIGNKKWLTSEHQEQKTLTVSAAGASSINRSGRLMALQFVVPSNPATKYTIAFEEVLFDRNTKPKSVSNGDILFPAFGDLDYNQKVQAFDASLILQYLTNGRDFRKGQLYYADVSQDSSVSALDASLILRYTTGAVDSLPVDTGSMELTATGRVSVKNVEEDSDGTVLVPVLVDNADNLYSFEGMLSYDPTKIEYQGLKRGEFASIHSTLSKEEGNIYLSGASSSMLSGSKTLFWVEFKVIGQDLDRPPEVHIKQLKWNENEMKKNVASGKIYTDIEDRKPPIPNQLKLKQNYPNPFNPTTTIEYSLPRKSYVTIRLYSVNGRFIRELAAGNKQKGRHRIRLNGKALSSGMYYYRLKTEYAQKTKKAVLLK